MQLTILCRCLWTILLCITRNFQSAFMYNHHFVIVCHFAR